MMTKQDMWQFVTDHLTDKGRKGLLRWYRNFRAEGMSPTRARSEVRSMTHATWMAKFAGWVD